MSFLAEFLSIWYLHPQWHSGRFLCILLLFIYLAPSMYKSIRWRDQIYASPLQQFKVRISRRKVSSILFLTIAIAEIFQHFFKITISKRSIRFVRREFLSCHYRR
jgi:hypothetical protein